MRQRKYKENNRNTPVYHDWSLDTLEISVYPASISFNTPNLQLNPHASAPFLAFQLNSGNKPPGNLSFYCCVEKCKKTRSYANQSELGEVRVTGSNLGGCADAPFFMR